MSYLTIPNFAHGLAGWRAVNYAPSVTVALENDPALARTNVQYAVARTSQADGSIAVDFDWPNQEIIDGNNFTQLIVPPSLCASVWIAARPGSSVSGRLSFWNLQTNVAQQAKFAVSQAWQLASVMDVAGNAGRRRIELYIDTIQQDLLIDSFNIS